MSCIHHETAISASSACLYSYRARTWWHSRTRLAAASCRLAREREIDGLRIVKVEEMSRGKGYICEHVCAHKSRCIKAEMLLFMQRANLRPSDDGQKPANISVRVVQQAFHVTTKARGCKKRRVKVSLFEHKCARYRVTLAILLATGRLRASWMFRNYLGLLLCINLHIYDENIFSS